jgi:hypothetical protein
MVLLDPAPGAAWTGEEDIEAGQWRFSPIHLTPRCEWGHLLQLDPTLSPVLFIAPDLQILRHV